MANKKLLSIEEAMKPTIITCGKCGGELHIIPYQEGNQIKTINICGKCTFAKATQ